MINRCHFGDAIDVMKDIKEAGITVQMCVTSPPYFGLRKYTEDPSEIGNEESVSDYVEKLVNVFRCVREIMADDGTLWLNLGDSYYNYRPGKGQRMGKQSIAVHKAAEIDNCNKRALKLDGLKEKDLIGIPWEVAFALRRDGWWLRSDIIWNKLSCTPESVKDRPTKSHEYIFLLSKNKHYYYDHEAIKEQCSEDSVKDYVARKTKDNKGSNNDSRVDLGGNRDKYMPKDFMRNKRTVWTPTGSPYTGAHTAVFPESLIEPCILAGSRDNDIVLDPFFGSGTTGVVCIRKRRRFIGIDLNEEYKAIQNQRLSGIQIEI